MNEPIPQRDEHDGGSERTGVVHVGGNDRPDSRQGYKAEDKENVHHGKRVDRDSPAAKLERAVAVLLASEFADQNERDRNAVADVKSDQRERDERIECRGAADVDQRKQSAYDTDKQQCIHGNVELRMQVRENAGEWQSVVFSKRPC